MFFTAGCLLFSSCGKQKKYESNAVILKKALTAVMENGEWEKAKALAYKAKEQNPDDPSARIMFALALEQCGDLDRAMEEINVAVNLAPSDFMANYTKGKLHFKAENYEDCPLVLEKAKELRPENPQVLLLLARTYAILNIENKAIQNYVALAKTPDYKNQPEVYNELGVIFYKKKDYKRAVRFFDEAYNKNSDSPAVNGNLAVFWDNIAMICAADINKASKAAENAVKYYTAYEELIKMNPRADVKRKKILDRIDFLTQKFNLKK